MIANEIQVVRKALVPLRNLQLSSRDRSFPLCRLDLTSKDKIVIVTIEISPSNRVLDQDRYLVTEVVSRNRNKVVLVVLGRSIEFSIGQRLPSSVPDTPTKKRGRLEL